MQRAIGYKLKQYEQVVHKLSGTSNNFIREERIYLLKSYKQTFASDK